MLTAVSGQLLVMKDFPRGMLMPALPPPAPPRKGSAQGHHTKETARLQGMEPGDRSLPFPGVGPGHGQTEDPVAFWASGRLWWKASSACEGGHREWHAVK